MSAKTERESRIPEVVRKASTPRVLDCREFLYLDFREFSDLDFRHIEVLELLFWFIVIECTDCRLTVPYCFTGNVVMPSKALSKEQQQALATWEEDNKRRKDTFDFDD